MQAMEVRMSSKSLADSLAGKRVLLLGGSGQIGRCLMPILEDAGARTEDPSTDEYRVPNDIGRIERRFDVVICLSATKPGEAKANPAEALRVNVDTVHRLIEHFQRKRTTCRVIFASSVRTVTSASVYAYSKIATEALVAAFTATSVANPSVTVMRFGNVLGGSNVVETFKRDLASGAPGNYIENTIDYFQSPKTIPTILHAALTCAGGTIITPLLPPVPIPFVAGVLAGVALKNERDIRIWNPEYNEVGPPPDLIPKWWIPFTSLSNWKTTRSAHNAPDVYPLLLTNFQRRRTKSAKETEEFQETLRHQSRTAFGRVAEELCGSGELPVRRRT